MVVVYIYIKNKIMVDEILGAAAAAAACLYFICANSYNQEYIDATNITGVFACSIMLTHSEGLMCVLSESDSDSSSSSDNLI